MTYIDGFVIPVPAGNKDSYRRMADKAAPVFMEHGALRVVEGWGDDVPDGKVTDFRRAVQAEAGEPGRSSSSRGSSGRPRTRVTRACGRSWPIPGCSSARTCPSTASA